MKLPVAFLRRQSIVARFFSAQRLLVAGLLLAGITGCGDATPEPAAPMQAQLPFHGQGVRILVLDDGELTEAAKRAAGEFKAQTGATLQFVRRPSTELVGTEFVDADVIVFPSHLLGQLAERKAIVTVTRSLLDSPEYRWNDVFEMLRLQEAVWGQDVYGVPLGSATLVCWYRADLLSKFKRQPPHTWAEYQELAAFFGQRENLGADAPPVGQEWYGAIEPLGKGWAGLTLLARAAAYAKHPDHYSTTFNIDTMDPLIAAPPFVRALEELAAAAKTGPEDAKRITPTEVRAAFWEGQCALALTWASAADREEIPAPPSEGFALGFEELPGSNDVYNPGAKRWDTKRETIVRRVPLLAPAGRLAAVTVDCRYPDAAWQFLRMISTDPWCSQVCSASFNTTLFRQSQVAKPTAWVDQGMDPQAAQRYAESVRLVLGRQEWLPALRLPGRAEYLDELDQAVWKVLRGESNAQESLEYAAHQWRFVTEKYGAKPQRLALLRGLGLSE